VVAKANVTAPQGAWLVYADAFHPSWRATVNGAAASLHPANLAFKALHLPPGASEVRLWFDPPLSGILATTIAVGGAAGAAVMLGWMVAALLRGVRVPAAR
jgi:hypothetical protein